MSFYLSIKHVVCSNLLVIKDPKPLFLRFRMIVQCPAQVPTWLIYSAHLNSCCISIGYGILQLRTLCTVLENCCVLLNSYCIAQQMLGAFQWWVETLKYIKCKKRLPFVFKFPDMCGLIFFRESQSQRELQMLNKSEK